VGALVSALGVERVDVQVSAAWALGPSGGERAGGVGRLRDERKEVRRNAAEALGEPGGERAKRHWSTPCATPKRKSVRYGEGVGKIGGERALDALVNTLRDETTYASWSMAKALGQLGGERALEALASPCAMKIPPPARARRGVSSAWREREVGPWCGPCAMGIPCPRRGGEGVGADWWGARGGSAL
jgi:HEAT repeat protein